MDVNIEADVDQDYNERCYRLRRGGMLSRKVWTDSAPGISGLCTQLGGDRDRIGTMEYFDGDTSTLSHGALDEWRDW